MKRAFQVSGRGHKDEMAAEIESILLMRHHRQLKEVLRWQLQEVRRERGSTWLRRVLGSSPPQRPQNTLNMSYKQHEYP